MKLSEAIAKFTVQMEADGKSIHTRTSYLRDLRYFSEWLSEDIEIKQLTPETLLEYVTKSGNALVDGGGAKSNTSINHVKSSLKSFFTWAFHLGFIKENPSRCLRVKNLGRHIPQYLTPADKEHLLKVMEAEAGDPANLRDLAMVQMFLGTGMRLNELLSLNLDDLDMDARKVILRKAKGGTEVVKFLNSTVAECLACYLEWRLKTFSNDDAIFISQHKRRLSPRQAQMRIKGWFDKTGLPEGLTVHSLRHSFATHLYAKTRNILLVKTALDHAHVTTTEIYAHVQNQELASALELV